MANKTIAEMSDEEIENRLSDTRLKIWKKEPLIRELSARYADKIIGNTKPDPYFRNIENNKIDISVARKDNPSNSAKAIDPDTTRNIVLVAGMLLLIVVCLGGCIILFMAIWNI